MSSPTLEQLWASFNFKPNAAQRDAIEYVDGPLLLTAGPGSGKTRVLLWRTLNLIVFHGVKPEEIFLSTFTEKAALQLKEGLQTLLAEASVHTGQPYDISKMSLGTVHSICQQLLQDRRFSANSARQPSPVLLDELRQYFLLYNRRYWQELIPAAEWSLYDQVQIDSDVEKKFVQLRLNNDDNILCFFKFPSLFKVPLPRIIGNYNPDWGIVRRDESGAIKLELVRETKGAANPNLLQYPSERRKIECAGKHFGALGVRYRHVTGEELNWWDG